MPWSGQRIYTPMQFEPSTIENTNYCPIWRATTTLNIVNNGAGIRLLVYQSMPQSRKGLCTPVRICHTIPPQTPMHRRTLYPREQKVFSLAPQIPRYHTPMGVSRDGTHVLQEIAHVHQIQACRDPCLADRCLQKGGRIPRTERFSVLYPSFLCFPMDHWRTRIDPTERQQKKASSCLHLDESLPVLHVCCN